MNRLLGTLFALATLAAIAFAILNYGNYTSMCRAQEIAAEVNCEAEIVIEENEALIEDATSEDILFEEEIIPEQPKQ